MSVGKMLLFAAAVVAFLAVLPIVSTIPWVPLSLTLGWLGLAVS